MIFINNQKFACESCIKGHRSSSCNHTERPLFEIKKKGRPVSQCEKCRELRKTKRTHNKCNCVPGVCTDVPNEDVNDEATTSADASSSTKPRRFKPIAPALPNGIKDLFAVQRTVNSISTSSTTQVDDSRVPCRCNNPWDCRCRTTDSALRPPNHPEPGASRDGYGLATLAQAAAFCCAEKPMPEESSSDMGAVCPSSVAAPHAPGYVPKRPLQPLDDYSERSFGPPQIPRTKRYKPSPPSQGALIIYPPAHARDLDLPPILSKDISSHSYSSGAASPMPDFPTIPPISTITSLAGSGCTCGIECTCPGCVKHRGERHVLQNFKNCDDGCGTCIDHEGGIELLGQLSRRDQDTASTSNVNYMDAFFAQAASLPLPPRTRKTSLDVTNVTVYPSALFAGAEKDRKERSAAFGLVSLPRLECRCAGGCGCPEGRCACGDGCGSCCDAGDSDPGDTTVPSASVVGGRVSSVSIGRHV